MKKNSHKTISPFSLIFALIVILAIGFVFGEEILKGTLIWAGIFVVAMFIMGISVVLYLTIKEAIEARKKKKEEETPHN